MLVSPIQAIKSVFAVFNDYSPGHFPFLNYEGTLPRKALFDFFPFFRIHIIDIDEASFTLKGTFQVNIKNLEQHL